MFGKINWTISKSASLNWASCDQTRNLPVENERAFCGSSDNYRRHCARKETRCPTQGSLVLIAESLFLWFVDWESSIRSKLANIHRLIRSPFHRNCARPSFHHHLCKPPNQCTPPACPASCALGTFKAHSLPKANVVSTHHPNELISQCFRSQIVYQMVI